MNLCAKFSKFLFSSDESSLLYPNPCAALTLITKFHSHLAFCIRRPAVAVVVQLWLEMSHAF